MAKRLSKRRRIGIICAVLVVLAVGALGFAGNFLFDFALNPHASYTMSDMMGEGSVDGLETVSPAQDGAYAAKAAAWFEASRESTTLVTADGTELTGWFVAAGADEGVSHDYAVVCHGYTGEPSEMAKYAYHFNQLGMNTLLPAARGHERNIDDGYITMGWDDSVDLVQWVNQIVERDPQARIVLFGVSMGGAEVMMASGHDLPSNVRLIIEDCGYTSVWDEFALQLDNVFGLPSFPLLNVAELVCRVRAGYGFEEASAVDMLAQATVPMLFIHGTADTFVPFSMLDEVYDACASPEKEKLVIEAAGHGQAASTDPELYWSTVDDFIARNMDAA